MRLISLTLTVAVVLSSCGVFDDFEPYAGMTEEQLGFIIPGSEKWGPGNPCEHTDCAGAMSLNSFFAGRWVAVDRIETVEDGEKTVYAEIWLAESEITTLQETQSPTRVRVWRPYVNQLAERAGDSLEVWVHLQDGSVSDMLIFDAEGRVGSVGEGGAIFTARPVAEMAAFAGAPSARDFLVKSLQDGKPDPVREVAQEFSGASTETTRGRLLHSPDCIVLATKGGRFTVEFLAGAATLIPDESGVVIDDIPLLFDKRVFAEGAVLDTVAPLWDSCPTERFAVTGFQPAEAN